MNRAGLIVAPLAMISASCGSLQPVIPPTRPSVDEIATGYQIFTAKFGNITYPDYVKEGYLQVDANCDLFFQQLGNASKSYDLLQKETILGIATSTTILALLHNSAETLALLAASGAFASQSIGNIEDYAILTRYVPQLKLYVDHARAEFKAANDPSAVTDAFSADDFVRQYANICTISGLEQIIGESINNTQATPITLAAETLALAEADVKNDLNLASVTVADLQALSALLDPSAGTNRQSDTKYPTAKGKYWNSTSPFAVRDFGTRRKVEIDNALALNPASTTPAPAGNVQHTPAFAPAPARSVQRPPAFVSGRIPQSATGTRWATPLINVPKQ